MKKTLAVLLSLLLIIPLSGCGQTDAFSPQNPVTITVWHYYASNLQAVFEESVAEFNNTRGKELGIMVDTLQVSNVDVLTDKIIAFAANEMGADPIFRKTSLTSDWATVKRDSLATIYQYDGAALSVERCVMEYEGEWGAYTGRNWIWKDAVTITP